MKFTGTNDYIASNELQLAVNAAITLQKPLLIKGEPGTGKTMLAEQLAQSLDTELIQWHIKSTTKAQQGLYEYDAVSRLRDSQLGMTKFMMSVIILLKVNYGRRLRQINHPCC